MYCSKVAIIGVSIGGILTSFEGSVNFFPPKVSSRSVIGTVFAGSCSGSPQLSVATRNHRFVFRGFLGVAILSDQHEKISLGTLLRSPP
eukprot:scaffold212668_cov63-Attheya_sp.AAC.2